MTNHESFGGGCVGWLAGFLLVLAVVSYLAGVSNLPGVVLGWIF